MLCPRQVAFALWGAAEHVHLEHLLKQEITRANIIAERMCQHRMYTEALEVYKHILQQDPECSAALCNTGIILERVMGDEFTAIAHYEKVPNPKPKLLDPVPQALNHKPNRF